MFLILLVADPLGGTRRAFDSTRPVLKVLRSLATITVPAHGFVVSRGLTTSAHPIRTQVWEFFKQLARGCAWAAAIAAGMLIYTAFTQKWKEKGYPTIPISALIAADQSMSPGQGRAIPLSGSTVGSGSAASNRSATSRQTSLLDLDEYEG